jgi:nitrate reductase assembly molybdenum cofactor insertion protein NarJ
MTSSTIDANLRDVLQDAAQWQLLGLLLECPVSGWTEQLGSLAKEVDDDSLQQAAELANKESSEGLYHTVFGPGGPAPPREVSYRDTLHPGRFLAEIGDAYQAFAYTPSNRETPDHIATECGFIAYLRLKEAYALARGQLEQANVCRTGAEQFVEEHLSLSAQALAELLGGSGVAYLALAGEALLQRVGPPRKVEAPAVLPDILEDECACG